MNETTIEVTFGKDAATEETLVGKVLTLTDAEGNKLTATYSEKSLDKEGKATFTLASGQKLVDTKEYTVTGEGVTEAKFIAKVGAAKITEFVKVTEAVPATVDADGKIVVDGKHESTIKVAAKDQYGEAITIADSSKAVEATLNGMPLTPNEVSRVGGTVTVTKALKEGDTLVITVIEKDGEKVIAKTPLTYEVAKAEKAVVKSITLKTTDNKTSVKSGETVEFTAELFNQFKSPMPIANGDIRWVVNGVAKADNGATFTLNEKAPGEYKVQAFSTANSKVVAEKTVTVGAAELTSIAFAPEVKDVEDVEVTKNQYNNEALVLGTLKQNDGAALLPSNIKFHVTSTDSALKAEDIKVTAEEVTNTKGEKVVIVKATSTKAGTFQVTPYVGDAVDADKVVKTTFSVTTTVNPKVATISDVTFDAAELKVGQYIYKEVVLKNKHGEVLTADQAKVTVSSSDKTVVTESTIVQGDDKVVKGQDKNKTYLKIKAEKAGTSVITLQAGDVVKTTTVKFATPTLTTIKVADSKITDVVAGDQEAGKYKLTKVSYLDQDGKEMPVASNATITVKDSKGATVTAADLVSFTGAKEEDGKLVEDTAGGAEKTHLKVSPKANIAKGTYTVELTSKVKVDGKDKDVTTSFQVVVGEARAAKTVEVTAKTPAITVGGTTELTIVPKDQYGEFIEVATTDEKAPVFQIVGDDFVGGDLTTITPVKKDEKTVAYKVTVKGLKAGSGTVKVNVLGAKDKDDKQPVLATASQTITVDSVGKLVDTVEITENEIQNTNGAEKAVVLEAIGKDKAGNEVAINDTDLTWSIKSVKDAEGNALTLEGTASTGAKLKNAEGKFLQKDGTFAATSTNDVTIKLDGNKLTGSEKITVQVQVQVATANNKTATSVVKFDGKGSKFAKDLAVYDAVFNNIGDAGKTVAAKDLEDNGLKISFTEDQVNDKGEIGDIVLTFTGVDQYGKPMVKDKKGTVKLDSLTTDNRAAVEVNAETLTLTAKGEGTATIYAKIGGETLEIEVTVPKAVVAKADKVKADAALAVVKTEAKEALTTAYEKANYTKEGNKTAYETAIANANKAIDAAKDAAGVATAKEDAEKVLKGIKTDAEITAEEEFKTAQAELQTVINSVTVTGDPVNKVTIKGTDYVVSTDGSDVASSAKWVTAAHVVTLQTALTVATTAKTAEGATKNTVDGAKTNLEAAITQFTGTDAQSGTNS